MDNPAFIRDEDHKDYKDYDTPNSKVNETIFTTSDT